jgi:heterodisulfide reductase subunit A-like polyferredoxin
VELNPDLLVLATAVLPNENKDVFELFKVPINADGFLVEAHAKLRPVDFGSEGHLHGRFGPLPQAAGRKYRPGPGIGLPGS